MNSMVQYPELYYNLYPRVQRCMRRYYPPYLPINQMPNEEQMASMVDEVYEETIKDYPEIDNDPKENRRGSRNDVSYSQRPFYGRRRLFRDLIAIMLLRDLTRRYRRGYGPGYGPGYRPRYRY